MQETSNNLVKNFEEKKKKSSFKLILFTFILIGAGIGSGYFLSLKQEHQQGGAPVARDVEKEKIEKGMVVGITDEKTFRDSAEGELEKGGVEGEGSHHLKRPGGESQNVYLTSSIVDLDKFVGRKIKVWGETFSGQKAGWLMDVGKVKVLN